MRTRLRRAMRWGVSLLVLAGCREDALAPARQLSELSGAQSRVAGGGLSPTTIYLGDVGPGVDWFVEPHAISSNGQWIGGRNRLTATSEDHGFVWHAGVMTDVGLMTGPDGTGLWSTTYDVNSSGVAVGTAVYPEFFPCAQPLRGFSWSNGVMTQLPPLPRDCESAAYGINDGGDVVGYSRPLGGTSQAVLWRNGVPQAIGPASTSEWATRISNAGFVLVNGVDPTFGACLGRPSALWFNGQSVPLPASFCGSDVGEDGTVVGQLSGLSPVSWKNGVTTPLVDPSAPGWITGKPVAINSSGDILLEGVGVWSNGRITPLDRDIGQLFVQSLSDARDVAGSTQNAPPPWVVNHGYLVPNTPNTSDYDFDGLVDAVDRCPFYPSSDNADFDQDGIGDVCDPTPGADLALTFGATPPPFVLNQQAVVQLLESNIGPGTSTGATVTIPPSPGFKFLSASGATCAPVGGNPTLYARTVAVEQSSAVLTDGLADQAWDVPDLADAGWR